MQALVWTLMGVAAVASALTIPVTLALPPDRSEIVAIAVRWALLGLALISLAVIGRFPGMGSAPLFWQLAVAALCTLVIGCVSGGFSFLWRAGQISAVWRWIALSLAVALPLLLLYAGYRSLRLQAHAGWLAAGTVLLALATGFVAIRSQSANSDSYRSLQR